MIAKKVFTADGVNTRFLSDFIIQSEQFARVYAYIYDNTLNPNGSEDQLQNGSTDPADWVWPSNIWKRGFNAPQSDKDLLTIEKWDLVTNSILTYEVPLAPTTMWIEVATTAEEFGDTLTAPSVERAETAADNALASELEAEASAVASAASAVDSSGFADDSAASAVESAGSAAESLASENKAQDWAENPEDIEVDIGQYSALHHSAKSSGFADASEASSVTSSGFANNSAASAAASELSATTSENFSIDSSGFADQSQLYQWESQAWQLTATSYATEAEDVLVNLVTSDGDGTFTYTPQTGVYSALHWQAKAQANADSINTDNFMANDATEFTGDANTLLVSGSYNVGATATNAPTAAIYSLVAFGDGVDNVSQTAIGVTGAVWSRSYNGTVWTTWVRMDNEGYATSTVGGTVKARLDGTNYYITTDGTDA